jgi:hypothetical protein
MSPQKETLMTIYCLLIVSMGTMAEDMSPPEWRGHPKSTAQEWDFMMAEPPDPYLPDGTSGITNNPYGNVYCHSIGGEYLPYTGPGPGGAWRLSNEIVICVPVVEPVEPYPRRVLHIQVTYNNSVDQPSVGLFDHGMELIQRAETMIPVPGYPDWSVLVIDYLYDWDAPDYSSILILPEDYPTDISEVVIDTIPEPSTFLLLTLGGCVVRKRRK